MTAKQRLYGLLRRSRSKPSSGKKCFVIVAFVGACVAAMPLAANADLIPVGTSYLVGSRVTGGGGIDTTLGGWAPSKGGLKIGWDIQQAGSTWQYAYTFTNADGTVVSPETSHFILEVSSNFTIDNILDANGTIVGPESFGAGPGNPEIPGDVYGIKFDFAGSPVGVYTLDTDRHPVWGDFYAKDGRVGGVWAAAWNTGFGTDPSAATTDFTNWIPTPDTNGGQEVPEPSSLMLFALGGLGLVGTAWRRRRLKAKPA